MTGEEVSDDELDARFDTLFDAYDKHNETCHYQSGLRLVHEIRRLAKSEHRLLPYIRATFNLMNDAASLLTPEVGRDASLEMIALLEHEDRARQMQPDFPEDGYEYQCRRFTTCAYDNFAASVATLQGYNSDGMYACISDGMQVCRRTGELDCLKCFREYSTEVYLAADDLPMAFHNARLGFMNVDPGPHDRRWVGATDEFRLLLMQGQIDDAFESLRRVWSFRETYHSPYSARLESTLLLDQLLAISGRMGERDQWFPQADPARHDQPPPAGEYPRYDLTRDRVDSLIAFCNGETDKSLGMLEAWDAKLRRQKCLSRWFGLRLQLLATLRLSGRTEKIPALAKQLETSATTARDWLTLRTLKRVLDPDAHPTPLALLEDLTVGPFARPATTVAVSADAADVADAASVGENAAPVAEDTDNTAADAGSVLHVDETTPLEDWGVSLIERLRQAEEAEQVANVLNELLSLDLEKVTHPHDAAGLLRIARFAFGEGTRGVEVWQWAGAIKSKFPNVAAVLCQFAGLGAFVNGSLLEDAELLIPTEELEATFQAALDLNPDSAGNHALAGSYYLGCDNHGEAERCLARAFRLDRTMSYAALQLAKVYQQTDRTRDALAVLDMCLREGSRDPDVAWQAALNANHLEQFEPVLTYLDRLDEVQPETPWSGHYRATALLELDRPDAALAAADREMELFSDRASAQQLQRAAALVLLDRLDEFQAALQEILRTPLSEVDFLSVTGLAKLHRRLWLSLRKIPNGDQQRQAYETFLLASGLMPDEFFEAIREAPGAEPLVDIRFFRCLVRQPLDADWPTATHCRMGEAEWTGYDIHWGVLAQDEADAERRIFEYQSRCHHLPARMLEVSESEDHYRDVPGVLWQGLREESSEDEDGPD